MKDPPDVMDARPGVARMCAEDCHPLSEMDVPAATSTV